MADLTILNLGKAPYKPVLDLQLRLRQRVQDAPTEEAFLVLVEHDPPVITLGRTADRDNVLMSPQALEQAGIEIFESSRGGDVTYHGPGQLVGYPIIRLDLRDRDIHAYIRNIEQAIIELLVKYDLTGLRSEGQTGVWVGNEKVAAIGIAVRRWVSYHGFALNVTTNLSHFDYIIPCGIRDKGVTSLQRLVNTTIDIEQVKPAMVQCLADVFGFDSIRYQTLEEIDEFL